MKKIIIKNWNQYCEYMTLAGFVDDSGWIILESHVGATPVIYATGTPDAMEKFTKLLRSCDIPYTDIT